MPIELGRSLNGAADWVCGSPAVYGVLKNPILTALIITAIALIVVFAVFRDELDGVGWRRGLKAGLWIMFAVSALVFVHYYALERASKRTSHQQAISDVADDIHDRSGSAGRVPVVFGRGEGRRGVPRPAAGAADDEEEQGRAETPAKAPAGGEGARSFQLAEMPLPDIDL